MFLSVWDKAYKADFIKKNNIKFALTRHAQDHIFSIAANLLADNILYIAKAFYNYRQRKGSAVHIKSDNNFCIFDNIELLKDFIIKHSLYEELSEEIQVYAQKVTGWHYEGIPKKSRKKYETMCRQYFNSEKDFKKFIKKLKTKRSFIENIFSLKNQMKDAVKCKAITILGITFLIKPRKRKAVQ